MRPNRPTSPQSDLYCRECCSWEQLWHVELEGIETDAPEIKTTCATCYTPRRLPLSTASHASVSLVAAADDLGNPVDE